MLQFSWVLLFINLVSANLLVNNLRLHQKERTGDTIFDQTLAYPKTFTQPLTLQPTTPLTLTFDARLSDNHQAVELDQAMVSFQQLSTGADVAIPVKMTKDVGSYKLSLTRKLFRKCFTQSGTYNMALVVGSPEETNGVLYELGEVEVKAISTNANKNLNTKKYGKKDEIRHQFGAPQKMPNLGISLIFIALVCVPLVVLVAVWMGLGANLSNLPKEPMGAVFLGLVGAYMGLAVGYWVGIKLFPTLAYCLVLAMPTYLVGQYALGQGLGLGQRLS